MTDQPLHAGETDVQIETFEKMTPERKLKPAIQPLHPGKTNVQVETFKKMTGEQKLKLSMRLYWSARRLKAVALRRQHPDWTEEQIQQGVTEIFTNART